MKKLNKLFAILFTILFAVLGVGTLSAQTWTDVTSTYIKNPTLIEEYYSKSDNAAWPVYTTGRTGNTQHPKNWILHTNGTTNHNIGGAFFECWTANQGVKRWTLFQDVTLPAGKYRLTGRYSTNENRGIIKTVAITPHHSYYSPGITTGNWGSWGIETAEFTIYEETQVRVGMISTNFAQCNGFTLTTTGAKQLLADEIAAAPEDLTEAVATAQGVYDDSNSDETAYRNAAKSLNDAIVAYNIENASESTPVDMTDRIANPSFEGIGGTTAYTGAKHNCSEWTYTANTDAGARSVTGSDYLNTDDSNDAFYCFNTWGGNAFNVSQTLKNMPAGNYKLSACYSSDANNTAILYLNSTETGITLTATSKHTFVEDFYTYKLAVDGDLVIGMTSSKWYKVDDFKLQFLGADLTVLQEAFAENYSNLQGLSTDNVPTAFANKISNLLSTYVTVPNNKKDLQIANTSISTIVSDHPSIVAAYAKLDTYVSTYDNSVEIESGAKATFKAAIDKAEEDADNAVTVEEINNAIIVLETARQTYVQKADPTNDTYFDYTFKIKDPAVVDGNGWTGKRTNSGQQYTGAPDNTYLDSWNGNGQNIYQEIANLPSGLYTLKAAGRASTSCTSAYIYLNDTKADFEKVGSEGNDLGQGWKWYTTEKTAVAGTAKVGFGCNTTSEQWAGADDFHLYYYGFDVETAQNSVTTLKAEAEALVDKPMNAEVATALGEAIAGADASKATRNELDPMIADLSTAIADAEASIAAYETIATYIAKANKIDESIAADYQTAYNNGTLESAETVFQELEVATYVYVKDEFSYPVELPAGEWISEGPTGSKSEQHWSGVTDGSRSYLEQSNAAWGENAWSISYKQDKTLPAGDYVFKVSGRRAAGTGNTLSLVVININDPENPLGVVNDFPEGDTGLGINKNGETSFDAEDEAGFANDGNGRGWQWRYVKFTLTDETTVQVAVEAEATTNHQWISFCDATLQMTEETYLDANKGALDAPTAEANALVDTKPMGAAENKALKDAIAMPVTTGAELLAKIEALETAVANANAWVATYNEAKAPLVAALERFETELNDGVNGCKYNMVEDEDVWATLIAEVGEAACTKDVTNDYYSFANAAEKLNNAIDEVHNWIRTNPTLNAKSATAVDMTDYYLMNASFDEGNTNGWEKTGSQTNNVAWSVTDGTFTATPSGSHYTGDAIWQKVNLAKGAYKLTVNLKAQEVAGHPSQVFVAGAAPSWNNNLSDLIASVKVTEFNKDVELSCIFNVATDADVYIGFNQKSGNVAGTGIQGSYTIYDFTLTQAANQIITKDGVITVVGENEATDLAGISSDENIVTVDLTGATWSEASTLSIDNKNSLVYVTDDANLTANNIVKVGVDEEGNTTRVAKSVVLTEGYKFSAREAFTATALNYARKFSANWLTVCLPFAYEIPEGVKVETLGAVDLDTKIFTFNEVTGTMEANKPYIIKNSSETAALFAELGDVTVEATPEAMKVEVTAEGTERKAEFIGTYTAVKTDALMENGAYDILFFGSDGQLYFLSQGVTTKNVNIKPFRAYIRLPKGTINWSDGQQAIARHGGGTTDIEDAKLTNDGAPVIYDLMGRKVNTIEKGGMYIVNGKKVVIR